MSSRTSLFTGLLLGVALVGVIVVPVYALSKCAACGKEAAALVQKVESNQMSLIRAIQVAEERTKGKAITAFTEPDGDAYKFAVYVSKDSKVLVMEVGPTGEPQRPDEAQDVPGLHDEEAHKVEKKRPIGG